MNSEQKLLVRHLRVLSYNTVLGFKKNFKKGFKNVLSTLRSGAGFG